MPQFDFFSFFVQIFWLTVGSLSFYLIYLKYILKNSSEVIKMRHKIKAFNASMKKDEKNSSSALYDTVLSYFFKK